MKARRIEKLESWSTYKHFETSSLEEAIELAKADKEDNWNHTEDDSVEYLLEEN